jgi:LCP family protein required for cell wall assembly
MRRIVLFVCLLMLVIPLVASSVAAQGRWDGESRFTILVMGVDRRPNARDNFNTRVDSILVLSVDPSTDSIGVLHIPRDLHVAALDSEPLIRVNTVMIRGEAIQEGYGPFYMMDTIGYNLGMFIDGFIIFDFEAFIALVDALGGVEVTINYPIIDPEYPDMNNGFDPFYLNPGTHLLDGRTALKFSRTRHGDNDYLRGQRQMQVLKAMGLKATDGSVLPDLIAQAPQLMASLEGHVYTDLTMEELVPLALFGARVPVESIKTGSLSGRYMATVQIGGTTERVNTPDRDVLEELMRETFGPDYAG